MLEKLNTFRNGLRRIGEYIYKYRFALAGVIFLLCVIFELNGSSIGCWKDFVHSNVNDDGVIFGENRGIRSDEWAVLTPMTFSQKFANFEYFSKLIRADSTDVFIVYGLPVLNILELYRPFHWGYILLGLEKGLAFFWCGRFIALFLVSFEFGMLLTKKNKLLSFLEATIITLSPMIQWWFAVNGVAELFIFGQLALLMLDKYMREESLKIRAICLAAMVLCAGGYVLVFYPAWQIPLAYVFLFLAIWIFLKNRKDFKINYKDVISIIIAIIVFASSMGLVLFKSMDTIKTVMGTVYPGARMETGGKFGASYIQYIMNIFLPYRDVGLNTNSCEEATMFSLFPMGILLTIVSVFRDKRKDACSLLLLIPYVFLGFFVVIGVPEIIAKITLISNSLASRAMIAVGFIDILLLIRNLSLIEKPMKRIPTLIITVLLTSVMVYWSRKINSNYIHEFKMLCMAVMLVYLFYFILRYNHKYSDYLLTIGIVVIMIAAGFNVNPIRTGAGVIYDSDIIKNIQEINNNDDGKWIVESLGFPIPNYVLMAGVPVINNTNTYPDMDRWKMLDENGNYEDVYNRYAHIVMRLTNETPNKKFELLTPDSFSVSVTPSDIKELDVKYIFTVNELEQYNSDAINFELLYSFENFRIYKVEYK